jgi:hypothetical protein
MLVVCRLAGLSALGTYYVGLGALLQSVSGPMQAAPQPPRGY